jgi:hypothetical protein
VHWAGTVLNLGGGCFDRIPKGSHRPDQARRRLAEPVTPIGRINRRATGRATCTHPRACAAPARRSCALASVAAAAARVRRYDSPRIWEKVKTNIDEERARIATQVLFVWVSVFFARGVVGIRSRVAVQARALLTARRTQERKAQLLLDVLKALGSLQVCICVADAQANVSACLCTRVCCVTLILPCTAWLQRDGSSASRAVRRGSAFWRVHTTEQQLDRVRSRCALMCVCVLVRI